MNRRIKEIADMVKEGMVTADIGTDHALLPVMLVKAGRIPRAYACDIGEGPLRAAAETVKNAGLEERVRLVLSDGFENVPVDAECAVIAGMGYHTAVSILERAAERLPLLKQILVQVNTDVPLFRRWISEKGWSIVEEKLIRERDHDYIVVSFLLTPHAPYSETQILGGPCLMEEGSDAYLRFVKDNIRRLEDIMEKSGGSNEKKKAELALWKQVLGETGRTE